MPYPRWRRYTLNEDFFATWTKELAWFVGYVVADGNIDKSLTAITLVSVDQELLELVKCLVGSDAVLYRRPKERNIHRGARDAYALKLSSQAAVEHLVRIGVLPAKSKNGGVPQVPETFFWHFLRGLLDGDGNIHIPASKGGLRVTLVNHADVIGLVSQHLGKADIRHTVKPVSGAVALMAYGAAADDLLTNVYRDSDSIRLERKHDVYVKWQQEKKPVGYCLLCDTDISTRKGREYCNPCRVIRQRLMNRRSDHLRRHGVVLAFADLALPEECHLNIDAMCARIYGRRAASNRAKAALAAASVEPEP